MDVSGVKKNREGKKFAYNVTLADNMARFVNSDKLFNLMVGSVGTGKTFAMAVKVLRYLMEYSRIHILIVNRTQKQMDATIIPSIMEIMPDSFNRRWDSVNRQMRFYEKDGETGEVLRDSVLYFHSFKTGTDVKSYNVHAVFIDEVNTIPEELMYNLNERIRGSDYDKVTGRVYPYSLNGACNMDWEQFDDFGGYHWVARFFFNRGDKEIPDEMYERDFDVIQTTPDDNPFVTEKFSKRLRYYRYQNEARYNMAFKGENLATIHGIYKFKDKYLLHVDTESLSYRELGSDDDEKLDVFRGIDLSFYNGFAVGIDWGGGRSPHAIVVCGFYGRVSVDILYTWRKMDSDLSEVGRVLSYLQLDSRISGGRFWGMVADNHYSTLINQVKMMGLSIVPCMKHNDYGKKSGIVCLSHLIENGGLRCYSHLHDIIQEFKLYRWDETDKLGIKTRFNAHILDALRYVYTYFKLEEVQSFYDISAQLGSVIGGDADNLRDSLSSRDREREMQDKPDLVMHIGAV